MVTPSARRSLDTEFLPVRCGVNGRVLTKTVKEANTKVSTQQTSHDNPLADFGPNEWIVDEMYQRYLADPTSVDPAWHDFFADYKPAMATGSLATPDEARAANATASAARAGTDAPAAAAPGGAGAPAPPAGGPVKAGWALRRRRRPPPQSRSRRPSRPRRPPRTA